MKKEFNAQEIYEKTLKNGGYSQVKGLRYMVGTPIKEKIVDMKVFSPKDIEDYIKEVGEHISDNDNIGIGTWVNENSGLIYFDVSTGFNDKKEAIEKAREWSQLAIYDTINNKTIDIE